MNGSVQYTFSAIFAFILLACGYTHEQEVRKVCYKKGIDMGDGYCHKTKDKLSDFDHVNLCKSLRDSKFLTRVREEFHLICNTMKANQKQSIIGKGKLLSYGVEATKEIQRKLLEMDKAHKRPSAACRKAVENTAVTPSYKFYSRLKVALEECGKGRTSFINGLPSGEFCHEKMTNMSNNHCAQREKDLDQLAHKKCFGRPNSDFHKIVVKKFKDLCFNMRNWLNNSAADISERHDIAKYTADDLRKEYIDAYESFEPSSEDCRKAIEITLKQQSHSFIQKLEKMLGACT